MILRRSVLVSAITFGVLPLLAGNAAAAPQVFGSHFTHEPANSGECMNSPIVQPCTIVSFIHPIPNIGDPDPNGPAPISGVVTKVRVRAEVPGATGIVVALQAAQQSVQQSAHEIVGTTSITAEQPITLAPTEAIKEAAGETPIQEFNVRLPIQKGEQLALTGTGFEATYNAGDEEFSLVYTPALHQGPGAFQSSEPTGELLIQGSVEPDADGDGFGDETQDQCPSQRATQGPCMTASPPSVPPPDHSAPMVSGLRVTSGRIIYTLSEAATVRIRLERKVGRRFRAQGGSFSGPGAVGLDRLVVPRFKKLPPGTYRLMLAATDSSGNQADYQASFRIRH